jgi:hypothetical protein
MIGAIEPVQAAEIVNRVRQDFQSQDHGGSVSPSAGSRLPLGATRAARRPFLMSPGVKAPLAILSSIQVRPAAWNARRHDGRQNFCCFPPSCRGRNSRSHQCRIGCDDRFADRRRAGRGQDKCDQPLCEWRGCRNRLEQRHRLRNQGSRPELQGVGKGVREVRAADLLADTAFGRK